MKFNSFGGRGLFCSFLPRPPFLLKIEKKFRRTSKDRRKRVQALFFWAQKSGFLIRFLTKMKGVFDLTFEEIKELKEIGFSAEQILQIYNAENSKAQQDASEPEATKTEESAETAQQDETEKKSETKFDKLESMISELKTAFQKKNIQESEIEEKKPDDILTITEKLLK